MVGAHAIHHLVHVYGCAIVFAIVALQALGAPLPGTTVLVAAAVYAAATRGLPIIGVIAAGAAGALAGTTLGFAAGRRLGEGGLRRLGRWLRQPPERIERVRHELALHGAAWIFVGRFITGLRNLSGLLAGACGMPLRRFLPVSAAAALAWAALNALEYYWFGRALAGASTWVQVVFVVLGLVWLVISVNLLRRRALRRLAVPARPSEGMSA